MIIYSKYAAGKSEHIGGLSFASVQMIFSLNGVFLPGQLLSLRNWRKSGTASRSRGNLPRRRFLSDCRKDEWWRLKETGRRDRYILYLARRRKRNDLRLYGPLHGRRKRKFCQRLR